MTDRNETAARARNLGADVLELLRLRVQLLALDIRTDFGYLLGSLLLGVLAVLLLAFSLAFAAFWITAALWETQRMWALAGCTVLFLVAGVILALWVRWRLRQGLQLFRSSLEELAHDRDSLRP